MTPGIAIRNLQLKYNRGAVVAVDDLSVDMFSGQVFALLGPNGAGKTSTLDCLTGIREPSDGQIIVNGKNAITDMAAIRESLGVCPQYDVLYDDMTVSKHIEFFGRLKGSRKRSFVGWLRLTCCYRDRVIFAGGASGSAASYGGPGADP